MQRYTVYLYLETALHVSGGSSTHHQEHKTVSTTSGTCQTVTATCRYRGGVGVPVGTPSTHHQEHKIISTASGTCKTVTATCRYRGEVGVPVGTEFQLFHDSGR